MPRRKHQYTEKELKRIGERLNNEYHYQKQIRKEKKEKYTQKEVADTLGLADVRSVSEKFNGHTSLSDTQFKKLAAAWGVRVEYLRGDDNYRTDSDVPVFDNEKDYDSFHTYKKYFKSIGFTFAPRMLLSVKNDNPGLLKILRPYITPILIKEDGMAGFNVYRLIDPIPENILQQIDPADMNILPLIETAIPVGKNKYQIIRFSSDQFLRMGKTIDELAQVIIHQAIDDNKNSDLTQDISLDEDKIENAEYMKNKIFFE